MANNRNESYLKTFGTNLRNVRKDKGISQGKLSIIADIPLSQIGRIERGEVNTTISTILMLSIALEIEPKALLDFSYKIRRA